MQIFPCILFTLLTVTNLSAQETPNVQIFVSDSTLIYSSDHHFNQQITDNKIVLKDFNFVCQEPKLRNIKIEPSKDNQVLKDTENSKFARKGYGNDDLDDIKEKVKIVKENISKNAFLKLRGFPSDDLFSFDKNSDISVALPIQNHFSKDFLHKTDDIVYKALAIIHLQQFFHYNSRSLDFCFSKLFSVRPPPSANC